MHKKQLEKHIEQDNYFGTLATVQNLTNTIVLCYTYDRIRRITMDTWSVVCQSCGVEYKVKATGEKGAIEVAKAEHERVNAEATAFRCDVGPFMTHAFNLTHPEHPCAPKEW